MSMQRIAGIALFAVGLILIVAGLNASESLADRASNFFTGHYTDTTIWYLAGGVAAAIVGFLLAFSGRFRR